MLLLRTAVPLRREERRTIGEFTVAAGERVAFVLTYAPSSGPAPAAVDPEAACAETEEFWRGWAARCTYEGPHREAVVRSLVTLKALTYAPTGGTIAAPTTSLPEQLGGPRNWDYRYCWLRDATFTLLALINAGYHEEAGAWRAWLVRAALGSPDQIQILYGLAGAREFVEWIVPWLPGYEGAAPVTRRTRRRSRPYRLYRDEQVRRRAGCKEHARAWHDQGPPERVRMHWHASRKPAEAHDRRTLQEHPMLERETITRAAEGAAAGLTATVMLQQLRQFDQRMMPAATAPIRQQPGKFLVEKTESVLPAAVRDRVPRAVESAGARFLAAGYGMTFGALYAVGRPGDANVLAAGVALGMATWGAGYLWWLPATKLMPPVTQQRPQQVAVPILEHVLFGIATAAGLAVLHRMRDRRSQTG